MSFDPQRLRDYRYPIVGQRLTPRDAMLYALGVGYGADPLDPGQLRFVYEDGLQAVPTMAITLCYPSTLAEFARTVGLDGSKVLHVSQAFRLAGPLPVDAELVGRTEVTGVYDKGPGRGVLWTYRNRVTDRASGALVCELDGASLARGIGGYGGPRGDPPEVPPIPARAPDASWDVATLPQAALLYRLSGDWNPLHADPAVARAGGFPAPILHGRCTFGVAGHAILRTFCGYDGRRLGAMSARFTAPVFPGETIRTDLWRDGDAVAFRARVPARDLVVLDHGRATLVG
jgi:acyl dehydratase